MPRIAVLSINSSWNIVNFRSGLIRRLQAHGFQVVALAPVDAHSAGLAELGVRHLPIAIDSKGVSATRDLRLFFAYRRALRMLKPAVFLGWTVKPNVYGSLAAHTLGIPVINNVSGLGTAFIRSGPLTRIVSTLYRAAFSRSRTVFFQNATDRAMFVDRRLVDRGVAALLPGSGIDLDRFTPSDTPRRPDRPFTFLLIARLLRDKGVVEFVEAARVILVERPDVRFELLGPLDVANRTAIGREEVDRWIASGTVHHLGWADDVRPYIQEADCIVLPSYREGMPRALLEAAALAKPLIATDVPGCVEIARAGENALLCAARDAGSLRDAMAAMLALSDGERAAMGAAGRRIAQAEFDEAIVADRYLDALDRALGGTTTA